ncbi:hypothetical protein M2125_002182 [Polynucleobacter sphagniphilus]|nr:hypothetical protein [Polynucleobacter sphagniphilus]
MRLAKLLTSTHHQPLEKTMTPKYKLYGNATDDFLFELVCNYDPSNLSHLQDLDSVLYNEIGRRKTLRTRLSDARGWRRGVENWESYKLPDWLNLCEQFTSAGEFRNSYGAAQSAARNLGLWPEIEKLMVDSGKWSNQLYGIDGRKYASRPELIVANWLHYSKIEYISHPKLKLQETSKPYRGDFQLPKVANIEVFMFSKDRVKCRTNLPNWSKDYLNNRQKKELYYETEGLPFIAIEAGIYRQHGYKRYLSHIQQEFINLGLELCDPTNFPIEYSQHDLGINWALDDFINYAQTNNIQFLSHFQEKAQDLYNLIKIKGLRKQVRVKLDELYARRSIAYKEELRPIEDVRADCLRLGIIERSQYEHAHQKGLFPTDTPYSILQSYGITWFEFINGRKIDDFWAWETAKQFVRSFSFQSKTEFEKHPKTGSDWGFIRKSPSAPSGGYTEWTSWPDFLGNVSHEEQQANKDKVESNNKFIAEFITLDTATAVTYLKKLGLENTSKLKGMTRLYAQLRNRPDWIQLRDMLAARIPKVKTPSEAIAILMFEKCFYFSDFIAWRESNPNLQRIPKHPDRLGKGVFELVRKAVGLPAHDAKIRSSLS